MLGDVATLLGPWLGREPVITLQDTGLGTTELEHIRADLNAAGEVITVRQI